MPLPGPTEKKKHWQDIVFTPLVTPGCYRNACVTVNEYGLVTDIVEQSTATFYIVDIPANLTTIPSPVNGDLAIVRDNSSGSDPNHPEALYVYDDDAPNPRMGWRLMSSTDMLTQRVDYRQIAFSTGAINALGVPVPANAIVKEVSVTVLTAYPPGTTIDIRDSGGTIYMPNTNINAQVAGTYIEYLSSNDTVVTGTQLQSLVGGGPGFGNSFTYIKFVNS